MCKEKRGVDVLVREKNSLGVPTNDKRTDSNKSGRTV